MFNPFSVFPKVASNDPIVSSEGFTDITVILDESGSMGSMKDTVVNTFNEHFSRMKATPGDNRWTMVKFDDHSSAKGGKEEFPNVLFERREEKDMVGLEPDQYNPRGSTALVDAVCMTIKRIDARCSGIPTEQVRPVVMVVTDGEENASREYTSDTMRELIADRRGKGWEFMYLAQNQDAWAVAGQYNMQASTVGRNYHYANASVLSGCMASGAVNAFSIGNGSFNLGEAISSGMAGCFHMASGGAYAWKQQQGVPV